MSISFGLLNPNQTTHARRRRLEAIQTLHALVHERLFGTCQWIADREIARALSKKLRVLGLNERVPGPPGTQRATALGREVNIDLMMVFMGIWQPYEVPEILEMNGLVSKDDMEEIVTRLEDEDHEKVLLPLVRRAFFQYFRAGDRAN